jgi:predicted nucleic acid-binding protein
MRPVLVDSNVVLDVAYRDPRWGLWSRARIAEAAIESALVINPIVFAEISIGYRSVEDLDDLVPADTFWREPLPYEAAFLAGKAFLTYRRRGGTKTSPLPDFYIGAHAAVRRYRLLTRDAARYRTYFPTVELIVP